MTIDYDPTTEIYTINGTAEAGKSHVIAKFAPNIAVGEVYTISVEYIGGRIAKGRTGMAIEGKTSSNGRVFINSVTCDQGSYIHPVRYTTFTVGEDYFDNLAQLWFYFYCYAESICENYQVRVQFNKGARADWCRAESLCTVKALAESKADAGQPATYNLPLSSGVSRAPACTYSLDQFGYLRVTGTLQKSNPLASGDVLGQLPEGYHPATPSGADYVERPVTVGSPLTPALLRCHADGRLEVIADGITTQDTVHINITYPVEP